MNMESEPSPFANWILPKNGKAPHYVDFSEFYFGRRKVDLDRKSSRFWKSDIIGLPNLARDFQTTILAERPDETVYPTFASAWRTVHRFIQDCPDLPHTVSIAEIGEIHGLRLKQWLVDQKMTAHSYKQIKHIVDSFSRIYRGTSSDMPARDRLPEPNPIEPDFVGLQRLSLALRKHARAIFTMWKGGAALSKHGCDPRVAFNGMLGDWDRPECQAHLIYSLTDTYLPSREELLKKGLSSLFLISNKRLGKNVKGPVCHIPGITPYAMQGYASKLRWRFPTEVDMAVFIWIVLIYTGFNLASVLAIDITKPSTWYAPSMQDPDHVLIFTDKDRAHKTIYAPSKVKAQFHAYNIIKMITEVTEPMRETLRIKLRKLILENKKKYSNEKQREIQKLEESIRSPWLYVSLMEKGGQGLVKSVQIRDSRYLNSIIRAIAIEANLTENHPYLSTLTTSQARDSMINFTFRHSRRMSVARMAAQQSDYRSLKYYLARRKIKRENFQTVNQVLTHTFKEIRHSHVFDETRIKIALRTGEITHEQERRLRDIRMRTRVGLGCKDPHNPPSYIDPHHPEGELCRVQRCTGCVLGIVFPESVRPLSRALADLRYQQGKSPLAGWKGSSFEEEEISIIETLKQFDQIVVKQHFQERMNKLKSGEEVCFDVYPQY